MSRLETLYRFCVWHAEACHRISGVAEDPSLVSVVRRAYRILARARAKGWRTRYARHGWVESQIARHLRRYWKAVHERAMSAVEILEVRGAS